MIRVTFQHICEKLNFHNGMQSTLSNTTMLHGVYLNVLNCMKHTMTCIYKIKSVTIHGKWVPVTTAWCVLRFQMEERPPIWRVAANILNKQSRTADKGWSSSLGFSRVLTTRHHKNLSCYKLFTRVSDLD